MGEAKRRRLAGFVSEHGPETVKFRGGERVISKDAARAPKVAIGYVHGDANRVTSFEDSLTNLINHDRAHQQLLVERIAVRCGTDGLPAARNEIVARFAQSDADWILWIDCDMGFAADSLYRLLAVAHPEERPIVGGLCFVSRQFAHDGMSGYRTRPQPTVFDWKVSDEDGLPRFASVPMYPVASLVQVAATGAAFKLVHKSVYGRIGEQHGPTWYDRTPGTDGKLLGEDISFCVRAATVDIPIHVHTGIRTSHYKAQWLSEVDHWLRYVPPPAGERVAVIVPVLRRPQNAEPFMRSLRASTGLATVYAVASDTDTETMDAWCAAGAQVIRATGDTFAEKANLGYRSTTEPWIFIVGDDVRFHAGWLDHAQHVAESLAADVVGTNDLANPRVMAGEHGTHLLIRRSYVDEMGASWDGPKVLAHEGYRHWFVDDEIVTAAKQRGVWQASLGSVVEHLHPLFGKGEQDEVYDLGQASAEQDREVFTARCQTYM